MSTAKGWQGSHRGFVRNVVVGLHLPDHERAWNMPLPKQTRERDAQALDAHLAEGKSRALAFRASRRP